MSSSIWLQVTPGRFKSPCRIFASSWESASRLLSARNLGSNAGDREASEEFEVRAVNLLVELLVPLSPPQGDASGRAAPALAITRSVVRPADEADDEEDDDEEPVAKDELGTDRGLEPTFFADDFGVFGIFDGVCLVDDFLGVGRLAVPPSSLRALCLRSL